MTPTDDRQTETTEPEFFEHASGRIFQNLGKYTVEIPTEEEIRIGKKIVNEFFGSRARLFPETSDKVIGTNNQQAETFATQPVLQPDPKAGFMEVEPFAYKLMASLASSQYAKGMAEYGTPLMAGNGRDALMDALTELHDGTRYIAQAILERRQERTEIARLRAALELCISRAGSDEYPNEACRMVIKAAREALERSQDRSKKVIVTLTQRSDDYHVCIEGLPAFWDCGKSAHEAINNLMLTHPDQITGRELDVRFKVNTPLHRSTRTGQQPLPPIYYCDRQGDEERRKDEESSKRGQNP